MTFDWWTKVWNFGERKRDFYRERERERERACGVK